MTNKQTYVIVPGWNGSPAEHWQSHWQRTLPNALRVEQQNWQQPCLQHWVSEVEQTLAGLTGAVTLIAHSLGCVTIAHWALQAKPEVLAKISGALLVAPADVERLDCPAELTGFAPIPQSELPFPSVLVGSTNDHAASRERALHFAARWGSEAVILERAGHINIDSGHRCWEQGFAFLYRLQMKAETARQCA